MFKVGYFDAQTLVRKYGFDFYLGKCNYLFTWNKITKKKHAFFIISSLPYFEKYCTNSKPLFLTESTYFHAFPYIYLSWGSCISDNKWAVAIYTWLTCGRKFRQMNLSITSWSTSNHLLESGFLFTWSATCHRLIGCHMKLSHLAWDSLAYTFKKDTHVNFDVFSLDSWTYKNKFMLLTYVMTQS